MKLSIVIFASLVVLPAPTFASPATRVPLVANSTEDDNKGSYIVKLKDDVSKDNHLNWLSRHPGANITYSDWSSDLLHGYAGSFTISTCC